MRYAILADIHGNLPALEAVLADLRGRRVQEILLLGDYFCDFPWPNAVLDRVRALPCAHVIAGNKEDALRRLDGDPAARAALQFAPLAWNRRALTPENRGYLDSLPRQLALERAGHTLRLGHAPRGVLGESFADGMRSVAFSALLDARPGFTHQDYLAYAQAALDADAALCARLKGLGPTAFLFGHYHTQWHARLGPCLLLNPGSCGRPLDGCTDAAYTLLDWDGSDWQVEELRVPYDREGTVRALRESALYAAAPVWGELLCLDMQDGRNHLFPFLDEVEALAQALGDEARPYADRVWLQASRRYLAARGLDHALHYLENPDDYPG